MKKVHSALAVSVCGIIFLLVFVFQIIHPIVAHAQSYDGSVIGYMYPSDGASPTAITDSPGLQLMNQRAVYAWITSIKLNTSAAVNVVDCTMGNNTYVYKTFTGPGTFSMNYPDQRNDSCLAIQLVLPTSVSATITLAATTVNTSSIKLSWNDPYTDTTKYYVCSDTNPFSGPCDTSPGSGLIATIVSNATKSHANTATSYTNTGLNPNTQYYYAVEAANHPDIQSDTVSATTNPNPAPVITAVSPTTAVSGSGATITVIGSNFNSADALEIAEGSTVYSRPTITANSAGTTLSFVLPSAMTSGIYNLTVFNANGIGSNSVSLTITALPVNNPPSNLTATVILNSTRQGVQLNWTDNASQAANVFVMQTNSQEGKPPSAIAMLPSGSASYFDDWNSATLSTPQENYEVSAMLKDNSFTAPSNLVSVSNCQLIAGSATAPYKIVFMRGTSVSQTKNQMSSMGGFLANTQRVISQGFDGIQPFEHYFDEFAFYLDAQATPDTDSHGKHQ